jgi:hypothetical protein
MKPEKGKKKERVQQPPKKEESSGSSAFLLTILFNGFGGVIAIMIIYVLFSPWVSGAEADELVKTDKLNPTVKGYYWLYHTMLKNNFETIEKYPDLNIAQRYELKWGGEIGYVNRIKQLTPDSAIIIIPPRKLLTAAGFKSTVELPWLTYFVYPRKVVYEDDKDSSKIYSQATHILALQGWGLDRLNYRVDKPEAFMILPLKK